MRWIVALTLVFLAGLVSAQSGFNPNDIRSEVSGTFQDSLCVVFNFLLDVAGPLAFFVLLWCALTWISSADDPAKREQAKDRIMHVAIGLIIILLAKGLAEFILSGTTTTITFNCPIL